jgi:hypothetical protein
MNKPKNIILILVFFMVGLMSPAFSFAQTETPKNELSYEVVLQILVASNDAADKSNVPQTLSGVVRKLKTTYALTNYRLASTSLQRIANMGNVEVKTISNQPAQNQDTPIFSEWTLGRLQMLENSIELQNFHYGQRIPIRIGVKDESGKQFLGVNYESVGLAMQKLNLRQNTPTVIGSLSTSNPDELMFLVLTVKPAEE